MPRSERRGRLHNALHRNPASAAATKLIVTLIGLTVIVAGMIMMVTPGPGLVALVVGLAILATEWDWADSLLAAARRALERSREKAASIDPATRRRMALVWSSVALAAIALIVVLIWVLGWPPPVVRLWEHLQHRVGWLPGLPGT